MFQRLGWMSTTVWILAPREDICPSFPSSFLFFFSSLIYNQLKLFITLQLQWTVGVKPVEINLTEVGECLEHLYVSVFIWLHSSIHGYPDLLMLYIHPDLFLLTLIEFTHVELDSLKKSLIISCRDYVFHHSLTVKLFSDIWAACAPQEQ